MTYNLPYAVSLPVLSESLYPFGLIDIFSSAKKKTNPRRIIRDNAYMLPARQIMTGWAYVMLCYAII